MLSRFPRDPLRLLDTTTEQENVYHFLWLPPHVSLSFFPDFIMSSTLYFSLVGDECFQRLVACLKIPRRSASCAVCATSFYLDGINSSTRNWAHNRIRGTRLTSHLREKTQSQEIPNGFIYLFYFLEGR